jgi:hypothetical protein
MATPDNRTVILILQELTGDLISPIPENDTGVRNDEDARLVLGALLETSPELLLNSEDEANLAGRRLLDYMADDSLLGASVREVLADPPTDYQLAPPPDILSSVVVLGALISFLQTKIRFHLRRDRDGTHVEFELDKQPASQDTLQRIAQIIAKILGRLLYQVSHARLIKAMSGPEWLE